MPVGKTSTDLVQAEGLIAPDIVEALGNECREVVDRLLEIWQPALVLLIALGDHPQSCQQFRQGFFIALALFDDRPVSAHGMSYMSACGLSMHAARVHIHMVVCTCTILGGRHTYGLQRCVRVY